MDTRYDDIPATSITADDEKPCEVCGRPTRYIDYCGEFRVCSRTCQDKFWKDIQRKEPNY